MPVHDALRPFEQLDSACKFSLEMLARATNYRCWLVAKLYQDHWHVLYLVDRCYGLPPGEVIPWADSICRKVVLGEGPRAVPDVSAVPDYANLPSVQRLPVNAYLGAPLLDARGEIFGTLCGFDPAIQPAESAGFLDLVDFVARTLATLQQFEQISLEKTRSVEIAEAMAMHDPLTGLSNRRGWDHLVRMEEHRLKRHGGQAVVIYIDLDNLKATNDERGHAAGDEILRRAGQAIRTGLRLYDVAARLGGDEFAILAAGCDADGAQSLIQRLQGAFAQAGIAASIGHALCTADLRIDDALNAADQAMLAIKRQRKKNTHSAPTS